MTNLEKYNQAFITALGVEEDMLATLEYQSVPQWDSVGHMQLIATLEDAFVSDDLIDFSCYEKGKEFMKKYEVDL